MGPYEATIPSTSDVRSCNDDRRRGACNRDGHPGAPTRYSWLFLSAGLSIELSRLVLEYVVTLAL